MKAKNKTLSGLSEYEIEMVLGASHVSIIESFRTFKEHRKAQFGAWCKGIIRNKRCDFFRDAYRGKITRDTPPKDDTSEDKDPHIDNDEYRTRIREVPLPEDGTSGDKDPHIGNNECDLKIMAENFVGLLRKMTDKNEPKAVRKAAKFILDFDPILHNTTGVEMAKTLHMNEPALRTRLKNARKEVKKRFEELGLTFGDFI